MLSYQIYNYYYFVNDKLEEMNKVFKILFNWREKYNEKCGYILNKILTSRTSFSGNETHYIIPNGEIVKNFDATMEELQKSFNAITVTIKYGEIKKEIETYKSNYNIIPDYIEELFGHTDHMLEVYQEWIQNLKSKEHAIRLGEEITKYEKIFLTCQETYKNFLSLYTDKKDNIEKEKTMEIQLLDVEFNLEEFNSVLESINEVYYELGNIMYPNLGGIKYEKLKIIKIESGSIWSILFGNENILAAVAKFLNKTVDLLFNKFTIEGKLSRQQGINSAIKDSLEMARTLKEMGYQIDESAENIQKAFLCSTQNLLNIATRSAKIKVNDEVHELKADLKAKYIEENKTLLLTDGNIKDKNDEE